MQSLWLGYQDFWDYLVSSSLRVSSFPLHLPAHLMLFQISLPLPEAPVVSTQPHKSIVLVVGMKRTCLASAKTLKNGWAFLSEDSCFLLTALNDFSKEICSFLRAYLSIIKQSTRGLVA